MAPYSTLFRQVNWEIVLFSRPATDTPVWEPAMRMNPSIKYNAARNHRPSEVVLEAGKENGNEALCHVEE
jgi:hypothetical protein